MPESLLEPVEENKDTVDDVHTDCLTFNIVNTSSVILTKEEQEDYCKILKDLIRLFQSETFKLKDCRDYYLKQYDDKFVLPEGKYFVSSSAKLGADYNSSIKGHNAKVKRRIDYAFYKIKEHLAHNQFKPALDFFLYANITHKVFYSSEILSIVKQNKESLAYSAYERIEDIRSILVNSVFKLVNEIAKDYRKSLVGDVIDFDDILQEGLILAYDSTLSYTLDEEQENVKWSTYTYSKINKQLSKYIATSTRIVPLPRYIQEEWGPVSEALERLELYDYKLISNLSNKILSEKLERKLTKEECYTPERVEHLIQIIQNSTSLESATNLTGDELGEDNPLTLLDILSEDNNLTEELVDKKISKEKFRELLEKHLTEEQWDILSIRWGFESGDICGLDETTEIYSKRYPNRKINKARVNEIEDTVKGILRKELLTRLIDFL